MSDLIYNRFWEKVDKGESCWQWTAGDNGEGYGRFRHDNQKVGAHRFSWEFHFGDIPDSMLVCHKCDNPGCVNPDHLFLGTNQDNMNDMVKKGRNKIRVGAANNKTKLNVEKVKTIRFLYSKGNHTQRELAKMFGVGQPCIKDIVNRITWKHVK